MKNIPCEIARLEIIFPAQKNCLKTDENFDFLSNESISQGMECYIRLNKACWKMSTLTEENDISFTQLNILQFF